MNDTQGFVPASITAWSGLFKAEICLLPREEQCSECGWCVKTSSRLSPECGSCSILGFTLNKDNWGVWELALFVLLSEGVGLIRNVVFSGILFDSKQPNGFTLVLEGKKSKISSAKCCCGCWTLLRPGPVSSHISVLFLCSPTSLAPSPSSSANLAR